MEIKICKKCNKEKPISEFYKRKDTKDGLFYTCKKCCKKYSQNNKKRISEQHKEYREKNIERIKKWQKDWYNNNKEYARERGNKYNRERRKAGLICKLHKNISLGIWRSLKNGKHGHSWETLVGYTLGDLKKHLECQFKDDMTWDNYGRDGWEIDHRIPISIFNITTAKSKGFKQCWALENLQPLWKSENRTKHNKLFY